MSIGDLWDVSITDEPFPMDIPDPLIQAPASTEEKGFWDTVSEFKTKADEFWSAYKRLEELEPIAMQTPDTQRSYNRVMGGGQRITGTIEGAATTVKSAVGWAGSLFGMDNVRERVNLGALGIWPIAIVAAAIAAIAIWLSEAYVEINKLESMKEMIREGTAPSVAGEIVRSGGGDTFGTAFGSEIGKAVAIAGVAAIGIWFVMRRI